MLQNILYFFQKIQCSSPCYYFYKLSHHNAFDIQFPLSINFKGNYIKTFFRGIHIVIHLTSRFFNVAAHF
jgi:hypothetical protein